MRTECRIWAEIPSNLPAWFEHNKFVELTPDMLFELYNSGCNVMLFHALEAHVLCVDSKRFTQR